MKSPFPGMDPYLEDASVWEEFHHVFITECMYLLSDVLPEGYVAKINERVELVNVGDPAARVYLPDVALAAERGDPFAAPKPAGGGGVATVEPVTIPEAEGIEIREGFIQLLRLPEYELVTSVELLSPWNKRGEGVGEYRAKRRQLLGRGVHVVEIDLLLGGRRTDLARPLPAGEYYAMVFRADRRPDVDVLAWTLPDPLPTVAVPLRAGDGDVRLDLAAVVASAYDRGRYARKCRYDRPPPVAVGTSRREWIAAVLRSAETA